MAENPHATPVSEADAQARTAFRDMLARRGIDRMADQLGMNPRTLARMGKSRDIPPTLARELANALESSPPGSRGASWRAAFLAWEQEALDRG